MRFSHVLAVLVMSIPAGAAAGTCVGSWSDHVAMHETGACGGGGHCHAVNPNSTAIGCHQMTSAALQDIGWKDRSGSWLPNPYGIGSNTEFASSIAAQNAALDSYTALNWSRLSLGTKALIGTEHSGVRITEGGLLSAAHFLGPAGLDGFVACGMRPDCISDSAADANGGRGRTFRIAMNRLAAGSGVNVSAITGFHTPGGGGRFAGHGVAGAPSRSGAFLPWSAIRSLEVPPHQGERSGLE